MIELKNISKTYQSKDGNFKAIDNVNLKINAGDIYGIIGYSGAGKSSLVRVINQLTKQTSGDVIVDGIKLNKLNKKDLRLQQRKIGMIFQHFNLLSNATVYENVVLPLQIDGYDKTKQKAKVLEILQLVGLEDKVDNYPSQLSGGQKQRVGIARALVNDPKILLCDEATSALDPQTTKEILELLQSLNQKLNLTLVVISHELDVIRRICHNVAVMDKGRIVEQNDVEQIFTNPQADITKSFVKESDSFEDLGEVEKTLKAQYVDGTIVKLTFVGNSQQPIISKIVRHLDIDISILWGTIEVVSKKPIGKLIIYIPKNQKQLSEVFTFIEQEQVKWEVL